MPKKNHFGSVKVIMRPKTRIVRCKHICADGTICRNAIAKIHNDSVVVTRIGKEIRINGGNIEVKCERCGQWTTINSSKGGCDEAQTD